MQDNFGPNNKHGSDSRVYSKIDRVLVDAEWLQGTPMFKVIRKLKILKSKLKLLNKDNFSDIENITQVTEIALKEFQKQLIKDPLNKELCDSEALCAKELHFLKQARSQYLLQKSKENWMKDGDDNTAFYHASIKHRRMRNRVYQEILLRGVIDEEVKTAMFSIPGNKAPGSDGYSSQFFKDTWHIVGKDVIHAVRSVFTSGKLLKSCNSTILTLVPKVDVPESVTQFRPISCCNTIYKCVAKVMCARLSLILPDIISPSQSAFIKGRGIGGNILLCQDLVKMYKRKACSPRIMMKIDLQKAYDYVEWQRKEFRFHPFCKSVNLSHLYFADDLIMLYRGDTQSMMLFLRAFKTFSNASGLCMNQGKSSIYSNGIDDHSMSVLAKLFGMKRGRLVLIKSVLHNLHNNWARIFILPKTVLQMIDGLCRKFLWHGNEMKDNPALVAWENICKPERKGGLGLKYLYWWNIVAVAKYTWWIARKTDHL
ncbi:uncharacterized protein LOC141648981 [Silene latifolia]|uniref:uncharacterized protein LOC141648981 n=1 Tax=Silene latifolia TaxID=37657 RepID=UPI003D77A6EF